MGSVSLDSKVSLTLTLKEEDRGGRLWLMFLGGHSLHDDPDSGI